MALVGQNQQTTFANPQNGQAPDADVIRGNDNALVAKHNAHDADATIHVQTGTLASRPTAGTAGAVYIDENKRIYVDNGSAWGEVPYARLDAAGTNAFTNNVSVGGNFTVVAGLTDVLDIDAADIVADTAAIGGAVTAASVAASGAVSGATVSGDGSALTNLNASNVAAGTLNAARLPTTITNATTFSAGGNAVVVSNGGAINFPANTGTPAAFTFFNNGTGAYISNSTAASVPGWNATGGPVGNGWIWVRVTYNNGANTGFIPVLI